MSLSPAAYASRPLFLSSPFSSSQLSGTGVVSPRGELASEVATTGPSSSLKLQGGEISNTVAAASGRVAATLANQLANRPLINALARAMPAAGNGALLNMLG